MTDRLIKPTYEAGKLPPQAVDIEEAVLGGLLIEFENCLGVLDRINAKTFYKPENGKIFEAMVSLNKEGKKIDILMVTEQLRKMEALQIVGGPGRIAMLTNRIASAAHIEMHCMVLREKQMLREQIEIGSIIVKRAYDETENPFEINDFAADEIFKISNFNNLRTEETFEEMSHQLIKETLKAQDNGGIVGLETGFNEQDRVLKGYKGGNLIVKGARPGMGKTAQMLCEVYHIGFIQKKPVVVFSMEMTRYEMFKRLLSIHNDIGVKLYKANGLSVADLAFAEQQLAMISKSKIIIVDNCRTIHAVRNRCKKESTLEPLAAVYIDYLQLMAGEGNIRENQIASISRGCKELAVELNIPVIALSQLGRSVETRGGDKRPMLIDLRESGAIEQDADVVQFIYRPQYYGIIENEKGESMKGVAYLLIAKHRGGKLKDIKVQFIHDRTLFKDFDDETETSKEDNPF